MGNMKSGQSATIVSMMIQGQKIGYLSRTGHGFKKPLPANGRTQHRYSRFIDAD